MFLQLHFVFKFLFVCLLLFIVVVLFFENFHFRFLFKYLCFFSGGFLCFEITAKYIYNTPTNTTYGIITTLLIFLQTHNRTLSFTYSFEYTTVNRGILLGFIPPTFVYNTHKSTWNHFIPSL